MNRPICPICRIDERKLGFNICTKCYDKGETLIKDEITPHSPSVEKCEKCHVKDCPRDETCNAPIKEYCNNLTHCIDMPDGYVFEGKITKDMLKPGIIIPHPVEESREVNGVKKTKKQMIEGFHAELESIGWDYDNGGKKDAKTLADYWLNILDEQLELARREERKKVLHELKTVKIIPVVTPHGSPYISGWNDCVTSLEEYIINLTTEE